MAAGITLRNLAPWLPTGVAVAFLLASLVTVGGIAARGDGDPPAPVRAAPRELPSFSPVSPAPSWEAAIGVAEPVRTPGSRPAEAPPRSRAPQSSPPRQTRTAAPPADAGLAGTYRVVDDFDGGFIGEVLIANPSSGDARWTVTLTVPGSVTGLVTSWVEGAPQATLEVDGRTYTWRSGVPVGAAGSVPLRFHFNGSGAPVRCAVNGASCSGIR